MIVKFTDKAFEAIKELKNFLIVNQNIPEDKASKIISKIIDSAQDLKSFPNRGKNEEYLDHLGLNHKRIIVKHCKVIYRIVSETIYITDVFDTRQSPNELKKRAK
jgi:plasmid stabilization system protein ParE